MNNRLKTTVLLSFMLSRGFIATLIVLEVILAAAMIFLVPYMSDVIFFIGSDIPIIFLMFFFGMFFFERHTAFCASNSVSLKYRLISNSVVISTVSLVAATIDSIARSVIFSCKVLSLPQYLRASIVIGMPIEEHFILSTILESALFYIAVFFVGYLLGGLYYSRGALFLLLSLLASAVVISGISVLGYVTWINPVAWIVFTIPAALLHSDFTTFLLNILISGLLVFFSYRLSELKAHSVSSDGEL